MPKLAESALFSKIKEHKELSRKKELITGDESMILLLVESAACEHPPIQGADILSESVVSSSRLALQKCLVKLKRHNYASLRAIADYSRTLEFREGSVSTWIDTLGRYNDERTLSALHGELYNMLSGMDGTKVLALMKALTSS
jgi:hypothetical protein